ncbi:MAG: TPM domain-containing protein, partial [Leptospira sp.]|nr:TPM domain-containing protein [Leptospira sp.]
MRRCFLVIMYLLISQCSPKIDRLPKLSSPVMDEAGVLSTATKQRLENLLRKNESETSNQIVVFIEDSLMYDSIEEDAVKIFETWKLGTKEKDNGVLLLFAMKERKVRIEVGYGLEDTLTDLRARRIIDEIILPNLKSGKSEEAVNQGISAILSQTRSMSPEYISQFCPKPFVDGSRWIHEDTIPLLQKEIQSRGLKDKVNFRFCVTISENQLAVDSLTQGILQNIGVNKKPSFVLVATKFRSENGYFYTGFGGSIAVSQELSPLFPEPRNRELFRNLHEEASQDDMTNYSFHAFLSALDSIEPFLMNKDQIPKEFSSIFDPNRVLSPFAIDSVNREMESIQSEGNIKVSLVIAKTNDPEDNYVQTVLKNTFRNENGILVLYSLNENKIKLHVSSGFGDSIKKDSQFIFEKEKYEDQLTKELNEVSERYRSEGDMNWAVIYAIRTLSNKWNSNFQTENPASQDKSLEKQNAYNSYPTTELPFIWALFRLL